jgi:hypothetical protein
MGQIDHDRQHKPTIGHVRLGGFAYDTPILAHYPIATPGEMAVVPLQSASDARVDGCILQDQTEANLWAGLTLTSENNPYPRVPLDLSGYWPVFDPAYQEYVQLTANDPLDRADWTTETFVVRGVKFEDRGQDGTCLTSLELEKVTDIVTGEAEEIPEPEPAPPVEPIIVPPPTWGGDLTHVILLTNQGVFVTETFHEPSPIWLAANNGLSTAVRQSIRDIAFDYVHGRRLFAVSTEATDGGAFRCNDIWTADTWAQQATNADAINLINAAGGPCTPLLPPTQGYWGAIWCNPQSGHVEMIAGDHLAGPDGCNKHKRAFYSADALATVVVGDNLEHDDPGPPGHDSTPNVGNITGSGGYTLYTYNCAWGAGGDLHRGISTNGGGAVNTAAGQVVAWSGGSLWHGRAGAEAMYYYSQAGALTIWKSNDNGATWAAVGGGGTLPVIVNNLKQALAMHHLDTSMLMYVTNTAQLRSSSDGGSTWSAAIAAVASASCVVPAMVSGFPEGWCFVAACGLPAADSWIYLTTDFGTSWENKSGNLGTWLTAGADSIYQIIPVQAGVP